MRARARPELRLLEFDHYRRSFVSTVITLTPVGRHNCEMHHRVHSRRASARYGDRPSSRSTSERFHGLHFVLRPKIVAPTTSR